MATSFVEPQKAGFSNAVSVSTEAGLITIHVSGAVGFDENGHIPENLGEQADNALASLSRTLLKCGARLENILKINTYIVDIDATKVGQVGMSVYRAFKHLPKDRRAASTWVGVTGLLDKQLGVEIECLAILPNASAATTFVQPQKTGFSNAVHFSNGAGISTLHVSGAVGYDARKQIPEELGEQAANALANISNTLSNCGASLDDIVKMNTYIVGMDDEKVGQVGMSVHKAFKHLPKDRRAAATWVGVTGLIDKRMAVEIECTAMLQEPSSDKLFVEPQRAGFSNAVCCMSDAELTTIYVSGAVGTDDQGNVPEDLSKQTDNALASLSKTLSKCGASFADIVKINTYVVDIDATKVGQVGMSVHKAFKHLPKDRRAATTWVGVTGLVYKQLGVEIECVATVRSAKITAKL